MSPTLTPADLVKKNREWAAKTTAKDPHFFEMLQHQQAPRFLWIGCSDSRVPANEIVDLAPGELFVHRNVANIVVHTDLNCLSVIQYAVDVLHVEHIIVCGHYGCGGIMAAWRNAQLGLITNWLRHIQDVAEKHINTLEKLSSEEKIVTRLAELNVIEQVKHVSQTTILQAAWERKASVSVHGWIYGLRDGLVHDLNTSVSSAREIEPRYLNAIHA